MKENSRDGSEKETLPQGAVASMRDFEECGSQQRCFWTTDTQPHAQSCLCAEQFKSCQEKDQGFFVLFKVVWNQNPTAFRAKGKALFFQEFNWERD